ncbi:hypothetical protein RHMOL_Rhmol08G0095500 [Rhododendron molle]|uniref:Uncharacterized protein n=1 Tax=Rhododendron molle TaxID=49168 RepID=A0ACC0MNI3_RHOML|nr:hypothetical protein RHMOL_Rhmol08G0095500 [Rhododendron molle]
MLLLVISVTSHKLLRYGERVRTKQGKPVNSRSLDDPPSNLKPLAMEPDYQNRISLVLARTKEYCSVFHGKIRVKKVKKLYLALAGAPLPFGVMIYGVSIWLQDFFRKGFRWAIDHDKWQSRVDNVFEEAWFDLGKSVIDKEMVEKVKRILDAHSKD